MRHEAARTGCHGNLARFQSDQVSRKKLSLQTAVTNLSHLVEHEIPAFCSVSYSRNPIILLFGRSCTKTDAEHSYPLLIWWYLFIIACITLSQQVIYLKCLVWFQYQLFCHLYNELLTISHLSLKQGEASHIVTRGKVRWAYMNHKHTLHPIQVFIRLPEKKIAPRSQHESCIFITRVLQTKCTSFSGQQCISASPHPSHASLEGYNDTWKCFLWIFTDQQKKSILPPKQKCSELFI